MNRYRYKGEEYPVVTLDRGTGKGLAATFGEVSHAEKLLGKQFDAWSEADALRVSVWLSIRRVDHTVLPWSDTEQLPMDAADVVYGAHAFVPDPDRPQRCQDCPHRPEDEVHVAPGEADPTGPSAGPQEA